MSLLLIVLGTPTGIPVDTTGQTSDPLSLLGNLSAPPSTAIGQSNDPFGNLGNLTAPPVVASSQSNDPFGNLGNLTASPITGSNQSNDPFAYLGNISTTPMKNNAITTMTTSNSLSAGISPAPLFATDMATPTIVSNFNDLVVPLETITPGDYIILITSF